MPCSWFCDWDENLMWKRNREQKQTKTAAPKGKEIKYENEIELAILWYVTAVMAMPFKMKQIKHLMWCARASALWYCAGSGGEGVYQYFQIMLKCASNRQTNWAWQSSKTHIHTHTTANIGGAKVGKCNWRSEKVKWAGSNQQWDGKSMFEHFSYMKFLLRSN